MGHFNQTFDGLNLGAETPCTKHSSPSPQASFKPTREVTIRIVLYVHKLFDLTNNNLM